MAREKVARADEIASGTVALVEAGGRRLALAHVGVRFYAVDDRCSHDEASLSDGLLNGHEIECPHHGARFDVRNGKFLTLPSVRPVGAYEVTVENGDVYVDIDAPPEPSD